jgi:hypothetical protein
LQQFLLYFIQRHIIDEAIAPGHPVAVLVFKLKRLPCHQAPVNFDKNPLILADLTIIM